MRPNLSRAHSSRYRHRSSKSERVDLQLQRGVIPTLQSRTISISCNAVRKMGRRLSSPQARQSRTRADARSRVSLPRKGRRVGLHIEGFSHFVTSMTAPIAGAEQGGTMKGVQKSPDAPPQPGTQHDFAQSTIDRAVERLYRTIGPEMLHHRRIHHPRQD